MNSFIFDYYDPIYSVILIILIAIIIAVTSQAWLVYKKEMLNRNLHNFLDKFGSKDCELEREDMPFENKMVKPLLLLAQAFEKSGNYLKTINILLYLIRHTKDDELLIYLGEVYLKAGFLQRAEEIFIHIIKRYPRRVELLYQLMLIYESLNSFDKVEEVIDAIEANGDEVITLRKYLKYLKIKSDKNLTRNEKLNKFEALLKDENWELFRPIIKQLFDLNPKIAWKYINDDNVKLIIDILWYLPDPKLQLDIILKSDVMKNLYFAKGVIEEPPTVKSGIFSFDIISFAKTAGYSESDVSFIYICRDCKNSFPISFERCPKCMSIGSVKVEGKVERKEIKKSHSIL